jgi:predicted transcriptional regulator
MAKTPPFSIRLDKELKARAEKVAQEESRSLGNLIEVALKAYLDGKGGKRK